MVDFHTSRPGHDLRYALDGDLMKELGWVPKVSIEERINQVVRWTLNNDRWLKL
jgi:dTDP-glucose 4,6-dehydratase